MNVSRINGEKLHFSINYKLYIFKLLLDKGNLGYILGYMEMIQ